MDKNGHQYISEAVCQVCHSYDEHHTIESKSYCGTQIEGLLLPCKLEFLKSPPKPGTPTLHHNLQQ